MIFLLKEFSHHSPKTEKFFYLHNSNCKTNCGACFEPIREIRHDFVRQFRKQRFFLEIYGQVEILALSWNLSVCSFSLLQAISFRAPDCHKYSERQNLRSDSINQKHIWF